METNNDLRLFRSFIYKEKTYSIFYKSNNDSVELPDCYCFERRGDSYIPIPSDDFLEISTFVCTLFSGKVPYNNSGNFKDFVLLPLET